MNLSSAIRASILANSAVTSLLATYQSVPAVISRKRLPADVIGNFPTPFVSIPESTGTANLDWLRIDMPVILRQISVYGSQPTDTKAVDMVAEAIRVMFHHQRMSLPTLVGFKPIDIVASYPAESADNDNVTVGRVVVCQFKLQATAPRS